MKIDNRLRFANHAKIVKREGEAWSMVKAAITPKDVKTHFTNVTKYGVPFLQQGGDVVMLAMLDLDDHDDVLGWDRITHAASEIMVTLETEGLCPNIYRSGGGKGINIWLAWDTPQDAHSIRVKLNGVIESVGYTSGDGGVENLEIEIFPKQDSLAIDDNGNCAAIPMYPIDQVFFEDTEQFEWEDSSPVPMVVKKKISTSHVDSVSMEKIDEMLSHIDPVGMDYDQWNRVLMAIHAAGGTIDQAEVWSRRDPEHRDEKILGSKWRSYKADKQGGISVNTLKKLAGDGYVDVDLDAFPVKTGDVKGCKYELIEGKGRYGGYVATTVYQLVRCLTEDVRFPWVIVFDEFTVDTMICDREEGVVISGYRRITDVDYVNMRKWFDSNRWEPVGRHMISDCVQAVANINKVNSVQQWAESLKWDGIDRYGVLLDKIGVERTDYYMAATRYQWTSHGARVTIPGYQADAIIVYVSEEQGLGKTQMIKAFTPNIPNVNTYRDIHIDDILDSDRAARKLRGCLIANMDEMRSHTKRESADIKSALSRSEESWTPKYKECLTEFKRTCLIYATTNQFAFLNDSSGERRYHPIDVGKIDLEWIKANNNQLWAQGIADFKKNGQAWKLASELAHDAHDSHSEEEDTWTDAIGDYLNTCLDGRVTTSEILRHALDIAIGNQNAMHKRRVSAIMRGLKWKYKPVRFKDGLKKMWTV